MRKRASPLLARGANIFVTRKKGISARLNIGLGVGLATSYRYRCSDIVITTKNFVDKLATYARHQKALKRSKLYSSKLYRNLKLTRLKNISIFILININIL